MSSGTYVKVGHYFARYHYRDKAELERDIAEAKQDKADAQAAINNVAFASPDAITPQGENPYDYISDLLRELWEVYEQSDFYLYALQTIKEGWDTKEED